jgi:hypothetical protein
MIEKVDDHGTYAGTISNILIYNACLTQAVYRMLCYDGVVYLLRNRPGPMCITPNENQLSVPVGVEV